MLSQKSRLFQISLTLTLQLGAIAGAPIVMGAFQPVRAEVSQSWNASEYEPTGGVGSPGRREPGGTRGGVCPTTEKQIAALVPMNNFGATTKNYPTFWFYMPKMESKSQLPDIEFVLLDEENTEIYKTTITTTGKPGAIAISLPEERAQSLKEDRVYHWYFSLVCNPQDRAADIYIDGWVRRIEPDSTMASKLQQATLKEKYEIFKSKKVWYDALATLGELIRQYPNDELLTAEWKNLLKEVELEKLAQEPIIGSLPSTTASN